MDGMSPSTEQLHSGIIAVGAKQAFTQLIPVHTELPVQTHHQLVPERTVTSHVLTLTSKCLYAVSSIFF